MMLDCRSEVPHLPYIYVCVYVYDVYVYVYDVYNAYICICVCICVYLMGMGDCKREKQIRGAREMNGTELHDVKLIKHF